MRNFFNTTHNPTNTPHAESPFDNPLVWFLFAIVVGGSLCVFGTIFIMNCIKEEKAHARNSSHTKEEEQVLNHDEIQGQSHLTRQSYEFV